MEEHDDIIEEEPWWKGPIKYILTIFLLLIIVTWTYSFYGVKIDPEPTLIPSIASVVPYIELKNETVKVSSNEYYKLVNPSDPTIKQIADRIASISCDGNRICQAKAIYYFVRDNYDYIPDPVRKEYVKDPKEFLAVGGGDCEDGAILLSNLLEAIGVSTEFVFTPGHALLSIRLPEAAERYKMNGNIYLDWTCKTCSFGEVSLKVREYI
jgi:transglutaminase-like putative cysteine protease